MLHGDCSQLRIRCNHPLNPSHDEKFLQQRPVSVPGNDEPHNAASKPLIHCLDGNSHWKSAATNIGIGGDAEESSYREPGETNWLLTGENPR